MGSFAPQPQPHVFDLPWVEAPSGFLARGEYKGKGLVLPLLRSSWTVKASCIASLITPSRSQVIGEMRYVAYKSIN